MRLSALTVAVVTVLLSGVAMAAANDIDLSQLALRNPDGTFKKDPASNLVIGDVDAFRGLTTELGFVFSPRAMTLAETTGHAGFDIGLDYTLHFIQSNNAYWSQATERGASGRPMPSVLQTLGVRARKGLPFSLELGGGATYLFESHMYAVGADVKWSLNEGFIWIPDLAATASVNRLIGNKHIDLTIVTAGGEISKTFGLFGMMRLSPFVGYNYVMINAASSVIDPEPGGADDIGGNFTFETLWLLNNGYHRALGGVRLGSFIFDLTVEGDFNFAENQSVQQLSFKLSMDF